MRFCIKTVLFKRESLLVYVVRRTYFLSDTNLNRKRFSKSKSDSSTRWLRRQDKDIFVDQARKDGYRCRSAYKLLEMDDKFNFLKPGSSVVDCGASPGSWTQVAIKRISNMKGRPSGIVIAVDLLDIQDIPRAIILDRNDFTKQTVQDKIRQLLPKSQADVVMSDMAPVATGNKRVDHAKIIDLNRSALEFAKSVLKQDGCFLCKVWDGNETYEFLEQLSNDFSFHKQIKPKASRMDSSEIYIFSSGFLNK